MSSTTLESINTNHQSKRVLTAVAKNLTTLINPKQVTKSEKLRYKDEDVKTLLTLVKNLELVATYIKKNL